MKRIHSYLKYQPYRIPKEFVRVIYRELINNANLFVSIAK